MDCFRVVTLNVQLMHPAPFTPAFRRSTRVVESRVYRVRDFAEAL
jgi:hypothetical protein